MPTPLTAPVAALPLTDLTAALGLPACTGVLPAVRLMAARPALW